MAKIQLSEPARVRLSDPADLAAAIPYLLGFPPEESLVVISLRGPRKRIGLTMRWDLPDESLDDDFAEQIALRLAANSADFAVVACFTAQPSDGDEHPRAGLIDAIESKTQVRDIPLMEALLVRDGRWWSYLCTESACCPPDGKEIPAATDVAAAHALVGRSLLPSRRSLEDEIKPIEFVARRAMDQSLDRVADELAQRRDDGKADAIRDETVELVMALCRRFDDPRAAAMTDEEAARVILGLTDIDARDRVMAAIFERDLDAALTLFIQLARRALPPDDAPTCTVLAATAYADGNGALANIALDRALASDPAYSLARLLADALHQQVPPSQLRKAWRQAGRELTHKRTNKQPGKKRKKTVPRG